MIALEREYEGQAQPVDLAEVLNNPDSANELEEFRKIFLGLNKILNDVGMIQLLKLLMLDSSTLKDLNELLHASELAKEIVDIIKFLDERYGSLIEIATKFESFGDADLNTLTSYIIEYEKVSGLLASLFKYGKIQQLNSNFMRAFPGCRFEDPK